MVAVREAPTWTWVYEEQYRCVPRSLVHIVDGVSLDFDPVIMKRVEVGIHPVRTTGLLLHLPPLPVLQLEAWITPGGGHDCPLIFRETGFSSSHELRGVLRGFYGRVKSGF